jgi:hypothetical protein
MIEECGAGNGQEAQIPVLLIRIRIHRIHMFWASWIRIHYLEVWIRIRILLWIRILLSLSKYSVKNLDIYCFLTSF